MKASVRRALSKLNRDRIFELLKENEIEEAVALLKQEFKARQAFHDLYVGWVNKLTDFLAEKAGEEAVGEFYGRYYESRSKEMQDDEKYRLPIEALVRLRANKFSGGGHDFNFRIEEDDEKFTFVLDPCGSGGRLIEASDAMRYRTKAPHSWGHRRTHFPYYCAHCIFIWELKSIDITGYPRVVYQIPQKPGDPCLQYMYKNLEDIPENYFDRLGRKKPESVRS